MDRYKILRPGFSPVGVFETLYPGDETYTAKQLGLEAPKELKGKDAEAFEASAKQRLNFYLRNRDIALVRNKGDTPKGHSQLAAPMLVEGEEPVSTEPPMTLGEVQALPADATIMDTVPEKKAKGK